MVNCIFFQLRKYSTLKMAGTGRYLDSEITEKYKNACFLSEEESQNDPANDPYKSKYKAREIFSELKAHFEKLKEEDPTSIDLTTMVAVLDLKLGINYTETEELASGQSHLEYCVAALQDYKLNPAVCNVLQHAYNQLGILWTGRRNPKQGLVHLQQSQVLYKDFKQDVGNAPIILEDLFDPKDDDAGAADQRQSAHFEDTYTHTLYYLAQVYTQLGETKTSAEYCHVTLKRQLDTMSYKPLAWALNAATLSQYYISTCQFKMARHCLASATVILKELGEPVTKCEINDEDSQADVDRKEKLPQAWSDLYRCWVKYGLSLLDVSRQRLLHDIDEEEEDDAENTEEKGKEEGAEKKVEDHNSDKKPNGSTGDEDEIKPGTSKSNSEVYFNLEVTSNEEQITDKYLKDFDAARNVFLCVQKWIGSAKEFYVLDGHCTDHIELVQDYSTAFKHLAFFEPDFERQCKMNKRRIDMLTEILGQLSTQHYMMICRQIMFEIAETYSQMLDLKLAVIESNATTPTPHAVKKINTLCQQSIAHFNTYINTLKHPTTGLPDKISNDDERPALIAHFYVGRLYSKFIQNDVAVHLDHLKHSLDSYNFLVSYCRRNPSAKEKVPSEFEVCEEMVVLLPHKMEKIRERGAIF